MRNATYSVVQERPNLIIRDEGPWDHKLTVTNDIESVVSHLVEHGLVPFNVSESFLYYDSTSVFTGVIIDKGKFVKFFNPNGEDDEYPDRTASGVNSKNPQG